MYDGGGCAATSTAAAADSQTKCCLVWLLMPKQSKFTCSRRSKRIGRMIQWRVRTLGWILDSMNMTRYTNSSGFMSTLHYCHKQSRTRSVAVRRSTQWGKGVGEREKNNKKYEYFLSFRSLPLSRVFYAFLFVIVCECAIYSLTIWHQRLTRKRMRTRLRHGHRSLSKQKNVKKGWTVNMLEFWMRNKCRICLDGLRWKRNEIESQIFPILCKWNA